MEKREQVHFLLCPQQEFINKEDKTRFRRFFELPKHLFSFWDGVFVVGDPGAQPRLPRVPVQPANTVKGQRINKPKVPRPKANQRVFFFLSPPSRL